MQRLEQKITPEKAVEILKEHGTNINLDEARIMLDFLYKLATLILNQVLKR